MFEGFYNDAAMLGSYGLLFLYYLLVLTLSILLHEFGHVAYFDWKLKRHVKTRLHFRKWYSFSFLVGEQQDYDDLTDKEYVGVNLAGILTGFVPIIISGAIFPPSFLLVIPYLAGSWADIREVIKNTELSE